MDNDILKRIVLHSALERFKFFKDSSFKDSLNEIKVPNETKEELSEKMKTLAETPQFVYPPPLIEFKVTIKGKGQIKNGKVDVPVKSFEVKMNIEPLEKSTIKQILKNESVEKFLYRILKEKYGVNNE